jgi:hypothetical protein
MTQQNPSAPGSAHDLRALLEATADALTLPYDAHDYDKRILARASQAQCVLRAALDGALADIAWNTDYLGGKLAAEQADADERVKNLCKRCHKPFDSTDLRFDGRARHKDTPFCRSCVDNCGNGGTEHACVICDPKRYGGGR